VFSASTPWVWYFSRGTGIVSIVLLTVSVALGIAQVTRLEARGWPRFVTSQLHKTASLTAVVFIAAHVVSVIADGYVNVRWGAAVIPFSSSYQPFWVGLGAVATDLLIALTVTSLLRQHIGARLWRTVHWTAYACWPVAFTHGLGIGTDTSLLWVRALSATCALAVVGAAAWRFTTFPATPRRPTVAAAGRR